MNILAKNSVAISSIRLTGKVSALPRRIIDKYQGFSFSLSECKKLLVLGDVFGVGLAVFGALLLLHQTVNADFDVVSTIETSWYWFPILFSSWLILAWLNDLYHIPSSFDKASSAARVFVVGIINLAIFVPVFSLIPSQLTLVFFLYFLVIVWSTVTLWRWTYAILFSHVPHRVLIVGRGKRAQAISKALREASKLNFQVLGYVDDSAATQQTAKDGLPVFGREVDLPSLVQQLQTHELVVAIERSLKKNLFDSLVECQANGVQVSLMSDLYGKLCRKIPVEHIDPGWVVRAMQDRPIFNRLDLGFKRLLDLTLGIIGLLIFASLLPFVALAIRLDSSGPIFYRQVRSGRAGKPFCIVKFRTMVDSAEKDGQPRWASKDDARITRVGRLLRQTRLDELPQVLNVLRGEMSIIGPRPERPEFIEELQRVIPFYRIRLMVKPGLTGWAQVQYEYGSNIEDALIKLQYDFYYLRYWSLWLDLYIIFRTFAVILKLKGI